MWNSTDVKNAFIGYGLNQRKKFFSNQDNRAPKYATAYLRVLYNAWELLSTGTFSVNLVDSPVYDLCKRFKAGDYEIGEVIQHCFDWETKVLLAYKQNPDKKTNMETEKQKFDPYFHEALIKVDSDQPENTILEVFQQGFIIHGKVLRHAKVKISSGKKPVEENKENKTTEEKIKNNINGGK